MMIRWHMAVFITVSLILHATLLVAWQPQLEWPLAGQQLINVALSPLQPAAAPAQAVAGKNHDNPTKKPSPPEHVMPTKTAAQRPATTPPGSPLKKPQHDTRKHPLAAAAPASATAVLAQTALLASKNITVYLQRTVTANFHYPALARRHGWQGKVKLAMHIAADGRLSELRVQQSSGHNILDHAALQTLQAISSIPEAVNWLQGHALDIVLPVEYRLLDS
jgi:protein TonB